MRPTLLLEPFRLGNVALLAMFSSIAFAQGNNNNNNNGDDDDDEEEATTQPPANARPTPTRGNNNNEDTTTTSPRTTSTTSDRANTTTPPPPVITGINQPDNNNADPPPSLTGGSNDFSYPPPAVPPTINAPFMQRSTMPDGSVFIIVGAILGAFGLAVLVWRAIVACLLHRSVARAAAAQHRANEKSTFMAPPAAFYNKDRESSPTTRGTRRTTRGPIPSGTPSQSNLFFSPTAAGSAVHGGNRDSRYLPSGFYAAGASPSPAMGQPLSAGYSSLRPDSRGQYSRNTMREHSPEGSPQFAADPSMSSLNLNRPPSQRAPSAYLDDLLDENPGMFPPSHMPPQNAPRQNFNHSPQGRH